MPKQKKKTLKKQKIFHFTTFCKWQKNGDFCGHKWPKGIICTHEIFFHFKKFWKTVSNGSKQIEMMFLQVFFNFDLFKHIYNQIYGEK